MQQRQVDSLIENFLLTEHLNFIHYTQSYNTCETHDILKPLLQQSKYLG
jgi:hypothetical protein